MKTYIGIDLGGTNVRAALVDEEGNILQIEKSPSNPEKGPDHVVETITKLVKSLKGWESAEGAGFGIPGVLDTKEGKIKACTNLKALEEYPICQDVSNHLGMPVFLTNDANAAGLGEAAAGAAKGLDTVLYVTVSTGIGSAVILNGKVHNGYHGFAGEICNLIVDPRRKPTGSILNNGAAEDQASGTAITRTAREVFGKDRIRHAGDLFDLAREGNEKALEITDQMAKDLAVMLANVALVIDPAVIVIGGGVMKGADVFMDKLKEYYYPLVFEGMRDIEILPASLEEPGIVGAAMLPKTELEH